MIKYFFLILIFVSLQNCKGQNDEKGINSAEIKVFSVSKAICGKNNSSQKEFKSIGNWKLTKNDVSQIIKNSEEINAQDLHYVYGNLPCEIEAEIEHKGKKKMITINAGGYYYIDAKIYGCKSQNCLKYFPKEAEANDDSKEPEFERKANSENNFDKKKWEGTYSVSLAYGKLDNFSEMSIDYDIQINNNDCTFSGMGYKTYFTDQCKIEEKNNTLILKYEKNIEGDGFSDHSNVNILGTLIFKNNKYYLKSPIVADAKWNYNTEIKLTKIK